MSAQLTLNLALRDGSSFANFVAGGNAEAVDRVRAAVASEKRGYGPGQVFFVWGETGVGKTHLLQAVSRVAHERNQTVVYIPLTDRTLAPEILDNLERSGCVCVDDLHSIAGKVEWERALFFLCERLRESGGTLVASATASPNHLDLQMPELTTRLASGPVYRLHPLDDAGKLVAVRLRARNRGLEMAPEVARYILRRYPRNMHALFELLERIDRLSLASQRRITIPLIRELG